MTRPEDRPLSTCASTWLDSRSSVAFITKTIIYSCRRHNSWAPGPTLGRDSFPLLPLCRWLPPPLSTSHNCPSRRGDICLSNCFPVTTATVATAVPPLPAPRSACHFPAAAPAHPAAAPAHPASQSRLLIRITWTKTQPRQTRSRAPGSRQGSDEVARDSVCACRSAYFDLVAVLRYLPHRATLFCHASEAFHKLLIIL